MISEDLSNLNNKELLALIAGKKAADCVRDVTSVYDLGSKRIQELMDDGLSERAARKVFAALELGRRALDRPGDGDLSIPKDVYNRMRHMGTLDHEETKVIIVNTKNKVQKIITMSKGTEDRAHLEPKDLFSVLLKEGAGAFFLVHNHPSGDPTPSTSDIAMTKKIKEGAELLGLRFLDHVIIGNYTYHSLRGDIQPWND